MGVFYQLSDKPLDCYEEHGCLLFYKPLEDLFLEHLLYLCIFLQICSLFWGGGRSELYVMDIWGLFFMVQDRFCFLLHATL